MEQTQPAILEAISPPPDSALALRQGTASSIKSRVQANGMKPTIIGELSFDRKRALNFENSNF